MDNLKDLELDAFFEKLKELRAVTRLDLKLVQLVGELGFSLSQEAQKVLLVYFSLLRDGNTCISLNASELLKKWSVKWNGLAVLSNSHAEENARREVYKAEDFRPVFEEGCSEILESPDLKKENSPFKVEGSLLFAKKYWDAKESINEIFKDRSADAVFRPLPETSPEEIEQMKRKVADILPEGSGIRLKDLQARAICCGQKNNLIITGGPGTGKTTVMLFLIWEFLKNNGQDLNWTLFFAAPSGKAANRLKESMELADISEKEKSEHPEMVNKIKNAEGKTLHRLLNFSPEKNAFSYNRENRFPDYSVFVIDEASMIDVTLFARFLEALPSDPSKYRLFILGDREQLPSVDAGAVLGELLGVRKDAVVELLESNRFPDDSKIGRFAKAIQAERDDALENSIGECGGVNPFEPETKLWPAENNVRFVSLEKDGENLGKKDLEVKIQKILGQWKEAFLDGLLDLAEKVRPEAADISEAEQEARKELWRAAERARILSAERRGVQGVEALNRTLCRGILKKLESEKKSSAGACFCGQILMFTRNQNMFRLYNGDSGVVVKDNKGVEYLMVKSDGKYPCYKLSLFPSDSLETAFAITIHKSQGSGYENILMFLPRAEGHPLLNRQILYTGVTRVKMGGSSAGSLTVVASKKRILDAKKTRLERDTGIKN